MSLKTSLLSFAFLCFAFTIHAATNWREVIGPSEGTLPGPVQDEVVWLDDLDAAFKEAKQQNRPLFVTFRCPPCDQCSMFDAVVLRGSPELTPRYQQFITARITNAAMLDERIFKVREFQDLDLSWWGYFLSPEGKIYGVYGGKDHVSDQTRISEKGLVKTMDRVLAHHYDPRRESWDIDGPLPDMSGKPRTPDTFPGYREYLSDRPNIRDQPCLHCHQVNDILRTEAMQAPSFDKNKDLAPWPLPENLGLNLDRDQGLLVNSIDPGSAADKAGIKKGDMIVVADGRKLFSQADFRAALHRASAAPTQITIYYNRNGTPGTAVVQTDEDWKQGINYWRKSFYDGVFGASPGFFPLKGPNQGKGSLSLKAYVGNKSNHPATKAGLKPNSEVIAVDGMKDDLDTREFMTWFRMHYEPGDEVTITVKEGGKTKDISYRLPRS